MIQQFPWTRVDPVMHNALLYTAVAVARCLFSRTMLCVCVCTRVCVCVCVHYEYVYTDAVNLWPWIAGAPRGHCDPSPSLHPPFPIHMPFKESMGGVSSSKSMRMEVFGDYLGAGRKSTGEDGDN